MRSIKTANKQANEITSPYDAKHLSRDEKVIRGAFYTPESIVNEVVKLVTPYIHRDNTVIADMAGGCGAFMFPIVRMGIKNYVIADSDKKAVEFLLRHFDRNRVFCTNSLLNVDRKKFHVKENDFLVVIGNPPYNDITSEYRKGKKGSFICDDDLKDRDMGISFLKAFNKLKANVICILHPLSYLIKETNFKRLKDFTKSYILKEGITFPSSVFQHTGTARFPVLIALYERNSEGMNFDYIKSFKFKILSSKKCFVLNEWTTTDGYVNKYPPRKGQPQTSPIGLYYYSFRDLNSVLRNASFLTEQKGNSVVVTIENFYKYAYLYCLKYFTSQIAENLWIFGNLSPLVDIQFVENNRKLFVLFALKTHKVFKIINSFTIEQLKCYYNVNDDENLEEVETKLKNFFYDLYQVRCRENQGKTR